MVSKGGSRRDEGVGKGARRDSSSNDEEDSDEEEPEQPVSKFVLPGDDTGSGIDYHIQDDDSWQTLQAYCKKWGIKQAHLELIYARFERTIRLSEHLDFTFKPQFHASLDFLADEFMTTAGEFVAQIFIQTWFLRRKGGLPPPEDRRCVNFARLVIMCCDLARLGNFELLANLWACVLQRFGRLLPTRGIDLDTRLNVELVQEVIAVIHTGNDKNIRALVAMLLDEAEEHVEQGHNTTEQGGEQDKEGEQEKEENPPRRYLTLRSILRFSFQHPPLHFPAAQFQRVLRSKIIGSRYWLRRRKPALERGVDLQSSLGLPDAYNDLFDRIQTSRDAWVVASGHILFHAFDARATRDSMLRGGDGSGRNDEWNTRCKQLLDNCLPPVWEDGEDAVVRSARKTFRPASPGAAGIKAIPALTATVNRFRTAAQMATGLTSKVGTKASKQQVAESIPGTSVDDTAQPSPIATLENHQNPNARDKGGLGHMYVDSVYPSGSEGEFNVTAESTGDKNGTENVQRTVWSVDAARGVEGNEKEKGSSFQPSPGAATSTKRSNPDHGNLFADESARPLTDPGPAGGTGGPQALSYASHPSHNHEEPGGRRGDKDIDVAGSSFVRATTAGLDPVTSLQCPVADCREGTSDSRASTGRPGSRRTKRRARRDGRAPKSREDTSRHPGGAVTGGPSKLCAVCLKKSSSFAMCDKCGRRAARALKDARGSRWARIFLVPYGDFFGVAEADALEGEGDAVRQWVQLVDDETGADFYYNVHYDSSVWKGMIDLSKTKPRARSGGRRKRGGDKIVAKSTPDKQTPPVSLSAVSSKSVVRQSSTITKAAGRTSTANRGVGRSAMTATGRATAIAAGRPTTITAVRPAMTAVGRATLVAATSAGGHPRSAAAKSCPQRPTTASRAVLLPPEAEELNDLNPRLVLDAHKWLYPGFRLLWPEDEEAAPAMAGGGSKRGTPVGGGARPDSRQQNLTGDRDRSRSRTVSIGGTALVAAAT